MSTSSSETSSAERGGVPGSDQPDALAGGLANLVQHGAALAIGLIVTMLAGRHLAPSAFGFFSLVASVVGLLHLVLDHGTGSLAMQRIGRRPTITRPLLARLWAWRRRVGLGAGLVLFLAAFLEDETWRRATWWALAVCAPLYARTALGPALVQAGALGALAVRATINRGLFALGFVWLAVRGAPAAWWWLLLVGRELIAVLILPPLARGRTPWRIRPERRRGMRLFGRRAAVLGLAAALQQLYFQGDVWLIRALAGEEALGAFASAARLVNPLLVIPALLAQPFIPRLSGGRAPEAARSVIEVCALAGGAIALGALLPAVLLLDAGAWLRVYGETYVGGAADARTTFICLAATPLVIGLASGPMAVLTAEGRFPVILRITAVGLFANVLGNLLLIGPLGVLGAALATLTTETLVAFLARRCLQSDAIGGDEGIWRATVVSLGFVLLFVVGFADATGLRGTLEDPMGALAIRIAAGSVWLALAWHLGRRFLSRWRSRT